ncbi:tripartite tricarboxylate transporter TctB family protein [Aneurinibacillus sp. Ricciae_BoGa-3]|uniref:tripartite tricarboxylate transporter TctB family protein n=1 Tax=Aneurinibacillus sp. Ricciae_BoGa-3 TaxID=3022697 RepID=UPI0023416BDA|nr:tripartite tricarboxylate transporter TctB family protein [Aneurinibacillus sp. Ricciae_BoGa-3]WCK52312.1 tripartite tricarboxylate transporter TctB family protein [Aneurinibacillus sp. Ricciae_BoGa-3]
MKAPRSIDRILFDGFLFLIFLTLTILAIQFQPLARELPLPIALIGVVFTFSLLLLDVFPNLQSKVNKGVKQQEQGPEQESMIQDQVTHQKTAETEWKNILRIVLWLIVFVVAVEWTNYKIATALFVFLVSWIEGRTAIRKSIVLSIGTTVFFYLLFDLCLAVTF